MQAVANNPAFAKKVGVPTKVGKEFSKEKNMKKGNENALMKKVGRNMAKADMQKMNPGMKKYEKGGEVDMSEGVKGITSRKAKKDQFNFQRGYRRGLINATRAFNVKGKIDTTENKLDKLNRGDNKLYQGEVKGKKDMDAALKGQGAYKKGGTVKSNAGRDGVATRGKTKGRMV